MPCFWRLGTTATGARQTEASERPGDSIVIGLKPDEPVTVDVQMYLKESQTWGLVEVLRQYRLEPNHPQDVTTIDSQITRHQNVAPPDHWGNGSKGL